MRYLYIFDSGDVPVYTYLMYGSAPSRSRKGVRFTTVSVPSSYVKDLPANADSSKFTVIG